MEVGFITPLRAEYLDDGKWIILEPLIYVSPHVLSGYRFEVPAKFYTDFASVPRIFWNIISPYGKHGRSSVLHDYLYYIGYEKSRLLSDELFAEAMTWERETEHTRKVIYFFVRQFGEHAWKKHRNAGHCAAMLKAIVKTRDLNEMKRKLPGSRIYV
jgi:hypothetical protein